MARGKTRQSEWPQTWYGPGGEVSTFSEKMYVPLNWTPYPQLKPELPSIPVPTTPSREELIAALKEKGVKINPQWPNVEMERILKDGSTSSR